MKWLAAVAVILAVLLTGLTYLPLAWVGKTVFPRSFEPQPQFLGTLWKGQIANIEGINPVNISIRPSNIFRGQPPATFDSRSPYLRFSGSAQLDGSVSAVANGNVRGLGVIDIRFQTLAGTYDLSLQDVIVKENCKSAAGTFRTNMLSENQAVWTWRGPILSGPITCEDGQFIANLSGSDDRQDITGEFKLDLSGQYRASVTVKTTDLRAEFVLPLYGFEKTSEGYSLLESGTWK